jgi:pyridoxine kinase
MNILSFQSEVVYGHVGQGAARFALQRLGHDVWAVPTVILSSHAGYARVQGETVSAGLMRKLLEGLVANGWLAKCDAVLSGYLGHADQAEVVADAVRRVKAANPGAIYCLDPVFGDDGRAYAKPGVAEAMAHSLLPLADIVTPNAFELSSLASVPTRDAGDALAAAKRLGRTLVVATSIPDGADRIGALAISDKEAWLASTPRLENAPHGAGDLFAALFLSARLHGNDVRYALEKATASVFNVLEQSVRRKSGEMLLIECQDYLRKAPPLTDVETISLTSGKEEII